MTKEELLNPRVKVVKLYPFSKYKVGQILSFSIAPNRVTRFYYDRTNTYYPIDEEWVILCPDIFKPMKWWEDRNIEEMHKYVKCNVEDRYVIMINKTADIQDKLSIYGDGGYHVNMFTPSDESEYLEYKSTLNVK